MQIRSLVNVMSVGVISFISSALFVTPADASLTICNKAGSKAFVAISYYSEGNTWSKGWLQLNPNSCGTAYAGGVANSEIGVYAETFNGIVETGNTRRCVIWVQVQPSWTIRNSDNAQRCQGKGREMKGFNMFRTGNSRDYTYEVFD